MKKLYEKASKVSGGVAVISYIAISAAMLLTCADVILRKLFNNAILGTYEITELLMACTVFASFAYTQSKKGHIRVSMFIKLMPRRLAMVIYTVNEFIAAGIAVAVTYASYLQIGYAFGRSLKTANLFIPLYPFYAVEMICMAFFAFMLLLDAINSAMAINNRELSDEIMSEI